MLEFDMATVTFAMLGKFFLTVCATTTIIYSNELFPTEIRSVAISSAAMCSRVISTAASYFGGPLVSYSGMPNTDFIQTSFKCLLLSVNLCRPTVPIPMCTNSGSYVNHVLTYFISQRWP